MPNLSNLTRGQTDFAIDTRGLSFTQRAILLGFLLHLGYHPLESVENMLHYAKVGFPFVCVDVDGEIVTRAAGEEPAELYKYDLGTPVDFEKIERKATKAMACYFPSIQARHLEGLLKLVSHFKVITGGRSVEQIVYSLITQPLLLVIAQDDATYRLETKEVSWEGPGVISALYGAKQFKDLQELLDFIN